jgi:hypothetical protein
LIIDVVRLKLKSVVAIIYRDKILKPIWIKTNKKTDIYYVGFFTKSWLVRPRFVQWPDL